VGGNTGNGNTVGEVPESLPLSLIVQVKGMECVRKLLQRSAEALRLLQLLQYHHVSRLAQSLGAPTREQLAQITFRQLVCSQDGEQIATRLVAALMEV
jgi:nuclear pore complex protein Nup155